VAEDTTNSPIITDSASPAYRQLYKDADSRLKGFFGQVTHPTLPMQRTYCFRCGAPSGFTSQESSKYIAPAHIVVTCDKCDVEIMEKYGIGTFPLQQVPTQLLDAFGIIPEQKESAR
jgi:hypothetical protein